MYYVRIKVELDGGGADEYHAALSLAREIANDHPGLTVEISEDKIWASYTAHEGTN